MKTLPAVLCVAVVCGCSSVYLKQPLPETPLNKEEQARLTGTWRIGDQAVQVAFASNGTPWMATAEWKDDDFRLNKYRIVFTHVTNALYVSIPTEPNGAGNQFYFAEIKQESGGKRIFVWNPDVDFFQTLIQKGVLKGSVDKDKYAKQIVIDNPAADILSLISTNSAAFDYKNPFCFEKLE